MTDCLRFTSDEWQQLRARCEEHGEPIHKSKFGSMYGRTLKIEDDGATLSWQTNSLPLADVDRVTIGSAPHKLSARKKKECVKRVWLFMTIDTVDKENFVTFVFGDATSRNAWIRSLTTYMSMLSPPKYCHDLSSLERALSMDEKSEYAAVQLCYSVDGAVRVSIAENPSQEQASNQAHKTALPTENSQNTEQESNIKEFDSTEIATPQTDRDINEDGASDNVTTEDDKPQQPLSTPDQPPSAVARNPIPNKQLIAYGVQPLNKLTLDLMQHQGDMFNVYFDRGSTAVCRLYVSPLNNALIIDGTSFLFSNIVAIYGGRSDQFPRIDPSASFMIEYRLDGECATQWVYMWLEVVDKFTYLSRRNWWINCVVSCIAANTPFRVPLRYEHNMRKLLAAITNHSQLAKVTFINTTDIDNCETETEPRTYSRDSAVISMHMSSMFIETDTPRNISTPKRVWNHGHSLSLEVNTNESSEPKYAKHPKAENPISPNRHLIKLKTDMQGNRDTEKDELIRELHAQRQAMKQQIATISQANLSLRQENETLQSKLTNICCEKCVDHAIQDKHKAETIESKLTTMTDKIAMIKQKLSVYNARMA